MASTFIKLPVDGGGPSAGVSSFNSRTGTVTSQSGDYSASQITNTPAGNISATDVQTAINELDTEKQKKFDPNTDSVLFDDFFTGMIGASTGLGWLVTVSGTGATVTSGTYGVNSTEKAMGVLTMSTGTTASGRVGLNRAQNGIILGYHAVDLTWRVAFDTLSDVTDNYICYVGMLDNLGAGLSIDGVFFDYTAGQNNWRCNTRSNNTSTTTDSGVAVTTAYSTLRIVIDAAATEVNFYIDGVLVATHTTNIPTDPRFTGIGVTIRKNAGTSSRDVHVDYYYHMLQITGGRG